MALLGSVAALGVADWSGSWETTCYEYNNCDGLTFVVASELLSQGVSPYVEAHRRTHVSATRLNGESPPLDLPFQYPPNALPLFGMRALVAPRVAHGGSALLITLAFLLLFWRFVSERLADKETAVLLMLGVTMSGVVAQNAELGQNGLLAAALVLGIVFLWGPRPLMAGALLGVLAFKPQYAFPILLVATFQRQWRVVDGSVGAFGAMTVLSGLWFGFDQWQLFLRAAGEPNHTIFLMVSWMGLAWRAAPESQAVIQSAALPVYLMAMFVLGVALWAGRHRFDLEGQLSVALIWTVIFSPNTHPYDLLVLAPALVYVSRGPIATSVGPIFLLITWFALPQPARWLMALGLMAFAVVCTRLLRRDAALREPPLQTPS